MQPETNALLPKTNIMDACRHRDKALEMMKQAAGALRAAYDLTEEANKMAERAHRGAVFRLTTRHEAEDYGHLFNHGFDPDKSLDIYRKDIDARIWQHLLGEAGLKMIMDRTERETLEKSLLEDVPEITIENIDATFSRLAADSALIFQRGLARCFSELDTRFKSHDAFKIGSRMILERVFDEYGHFTYSSMREQTIIDVERVFSVLDGKRPDAYSLLKAIRDSRDKGLRPHQSECVSDYFRVRGFKNGNAHFWFTRDDLVTEANKVLAQYYGEVIADAAPADMDADGFRKHSSNLPAKDLQFYETPEAVAKRLIEDCHFGERCRILEPSAGKGAIIKAIPEREDIVVDAVEIHPDRVKALRELRRPWGVRINVNAANFLQLEPLEAYDLVLMNPPFYGTHWMDHVRHAFKFLKPGGRLRAILPVSAEVSESKAHLAFRRWAEKVGGPYHRLFRSLPPESFASSGTRINTVILDLRK